VTTGVYNTFLYAEYGVTSRLTAIANANLFGRNIVNELESATTGETLLAGDALNNLGDIDLALKYALTKPGTAWAVSATMLFGLPTGQSTGGMLNNLQTGDGEFNQLARLDAGRGFQISESVSAYASAYAGFNNRTQGFSEELRVGAEGGLGLANSRLWLIGRLDVLESLKNGETASTSTNTTGIFANNAEFISLGAELNYYVAERVGLSVGVAGALRGEIIAAAPSYSVGVFVDLTR